MHFAQAEGPRGFIWRYALAYILATALMGGIAFWLFQPLLGLIWNAIFQAAQGTSESEIEAIFTREITLMVGRIVFGYIAMMLLGILFWAVFEAAIQRRYVREDGFRIGLGADEIRVFVVGLMWLVFGIVSYILTGIVAAVLMGILLSISNNWMALGIGFPAVFLASALAWAYFAVRLSPASAMTVRDRRIQFLNAWGATRGRVLPLFFAVVVLAVICWIIFMIFYTLGAAALIGTFVAVIGNPEVIEQNPARVFQFILTGQFIAPFIGFYVVILLIQGICFYIWSGPAALAAKTDLRGGGTAQAPDVVL